MFQVTILQTQRMILSPCKPADRDDFISLEQDPDVMRYLNGGYAVDPAIANEQSTFLMPRGHELYVWTARAVQNNDFIGWFCLWPDGERLAELGYRLRQSKWGQGFATEGASALLSWAFDANLYDKVVATTLTVNHGSRRVMEKIGLRYSRTDPVPAPEMFPGCEHGEVWYEIHRNDVEAV